MMPSRTVRASFQGNARATGAKANTTERSAIFAATSLSITIAAMSRSLSSTNSSSLVPERNSSAASRVSVSSPARGGS